MIDVRFRIGFGSRNPSNTFSQFSQSFSLSDDSFTLAWSDQTSTFIHDHDQMDLMTSWLMSVEIKNQNHHHTNVTRAIYCPQLILIIMSTSSICISLLAAVAMLALGYSFSRQRTTQHQQLQDQVAELQRQLNQLATAASSDTVLQEHHRFLPKKDKEDKKDKKDKENERLLSCACNDTTSGFTYASDFGIMGDATTDDTLALQAAIDSASANDSGGIVVLPKGTFRIFEPLIVPAGVTLQGQGYGDSPLAISFDAGASTIAYCGTDYAVKLGGHAAGLRDLAVYDWPMVPIVKTSKPQEVCWLKQMLR